MRIIGGEAGSRKIEAPKGIITRPTLDRVRETVFNVIQFRTANAHVLDLFAGSGAYGLEALSRGAEKAVFNDNNVSARNIVRRNIQALGYQERSEILKYDWDMALSSLHDRRLCFDLIFLDPPYRMPLDPVIEKISSLSLLSQSGIVIAEVGGHTPEIPGLMQINRIKKIGITTVLFISY